MRGTGDRAAREAAYRSGGAAASAAWTAFVRYRLFCVPAVVLLYAAAVLALGDGLGVSSNYFVIAPVAAAALGFGAIGGLVAGALGLPANLLLFAALGHPEFSPASKAIAELSGLAVGYLLGRFADYYKDVDREIRKRVATEEALRAALAEKELLLSELHHRVKNNLSVIKGLVQLQRNRSGDPGFRAASNDLIGRIFAISLVHDQLGRDQALSTIDPAEYVGALVRNIAEGLGLDASRIGLALDSGGRAMQTEAATSLGLVVNEVLTNALKHAVGREPAIRVSLRLEMGEYVLSIEDDGPGPSPDYAAAGGLGLKLVRSLARNLGGRASLESVEGPGGASGARFTLIFPAEFMELVVSPPEDPAEDGEP